MRLLAIACAAALLLLAACPKGGGSASSGGSVPATPPPPPAPKVIIPAGTLAWQGWQLGSGWEDAKARLGPDVKLLELWAPQGGSGTVSAVPTNGESLPETALVFKDGQLVGYNYSAYMPVEQFGNLRKELGASYGEPASMPPAWALAAPYFAGYDPPIKELTCYYWCDEPARAVMQLMFNSITSLGIIALVNVDYYKQAVDEANTIPAPGAAAAAGAASTGEAAPPATSAQPGAASPDTAAAPAVKATTTCRFALAGHQLGEPASAALRAFPDDGTLIVSRLWAVEGQTGSLSSNPSDLSQPYPAVAAWLLGGALAGYIRTEELTREEFIAATDAFDQDYGAALFDPPAWYLATPDGKNYRKPDSDTEQLIWPDETSRAILFAQYNYKDHTATFMLLDTYAYPLALDQTMGSLGYGNK